MCSWPTASKEPIIASSGRWSSQLMDRQATASSGRLHADSRNAQPQSILPDKMQASNVLASILLVNSSSEATVKLARIADSREECLILLVGDWGNADCSCSDLLGVGDT